MAGEDRTFSQRFEYKYLTTDAQADMARDFTQQYLQLDSHADESLDNQYCIASLYLDSPTLTLYNGTVMGEKNRFKLRVRCYDDDPASPAFLEIKARKNDVIFKKRAGVRKTSLEDILGTYWSNSDDLIDPSDTEMGALENFCELAAVTRARPKVVVRYMREAYVDPWGGSVRVTFDRELAGLPTDETEVTRNGSGWTSVGAAFHVIEVKFTDSFPNWAREMVQACNLQRTSAAKYITCIDTLMEQGTRLVG